MFFFFCLCSNYVSEILFWQLNLWQQSIPCFKCQDFCCLKILERKSEYSTCVYIYRLIYRQIWCQITDGRKSRHLEETVFMSKVCNGTIALTLSQLLPITMSWPLCCLVCKPVLFEWIYDHLQPSIQIHSNQLWHLWWLHFPLPSAVNFNKA